MAESRTDKYLVEFIAEWIRDPKMRKKILHREVSELDSKWPDQSCTLRALKRNDIIRLLVNELEQVLKIDLRRVHHDVYDDYEEGDPFDGDGDDWHEHDAVCVLYEERESHVRGVEPATITANEEKIVVVRGHGWDDDVEIRFGLPNADEADPGIPGTVLGVSSDVDIYQRAVVKVTLPPGEWTVNAIVTGKVPSKKTVVLNAI